MDEERQAVEALISSAKLLEIMCEEIEQELEELRIMKDKAHE